jgi:ABC-type glutathione transport system ATPase component
MTHAAVNGRPHLAAPDPSVVSPLPDSTASPGKAGEVLAAAGIEKSYRRGPWPLRRRQQVLRGADLTLYPGEVVGLVGRTDPARAP